MSYAIESVCRMIEGTAFLKKKTTFFFIYTGRGCWVEGILFVCGNLHACPPTAKRHATV